MVVGRFFEGNRRHIHENGDDRMRKSRRRIVVLTVTIAVFVAFLISSMLFVSYVRNKEEQEMLAYLQGITGQRRDVVIQQIQGDLQLLHGTAISLSEMNLSDLSPLTDLLRRINQSNSFIRMGIVLPDGRMNVVDMNGSTYLNVDMSEADFLRKAMRGRDVISERTYESFTGEYVIYNAVPVWRGMDVVGVLCAAHTDETIGSLIDMPVFIDAGYFGIVNGEGRFIAAGNTLLKPDEETPDLFSLGQYAAEEVQSLQAALSASQAGAFTYTEAGQEQILTLSPLGLNDWSIIGVVPRAKITGQESDVVIGAMVLTILASALILGLLYWQTRTLRENHSDLEKLAYVDSLTGISNYLKFQLDAQEILCGHPDMRFAVWTFDTKSFTNINAIFGTEVGDRVLVRIAKVLGTDAPEASAYCRVSGDMFAGIRPYASPTDVTDWFWQVIAMLAKREVIPENLMHIDDAMGIYCIDDFDDRPTISEMVNMATIAKLVAKQQMGNGVMFFTTSMRDTQRWHTQLEAAGPDALKNGDITFFLQPKVCLREKYRIVGAEVLARWKHSTHGYIQPGEFIPLFEKNGFIVEMDRNIFEQACQWYVHCRDEGIAPVCLAVNVSRLGLLRRDFVEYYGSVKERYGIEDGVLELEFTESMILDDYEAFKAIVLALKARGFVCSIDDFGSGYSSLNVLKSLPIDVLKLDALFFRKNPADIEERDEVVVANFIRMARELGVQTVAEGVEETRQVAFLSDSGCDMIQGYVFSRPLPKEEFARLLTGTGGKLPLPEG